VGLAPEDLAISRFAAAASRMVTPWTPPTDARPVGLAARALDLAMIAWMFLANGAVFPLLLSEPGSADYTDDARLVLRLLVLPSMALAPLLVLSRPCAVSGQLLRHPLLPFILLWVWCSAAWSLDPETTVRRAAALTAYTLIACWLAVAYPPAALLRRLTWIFLAQLVLTVVFAVAVPGLAYMPDDHLLRGIFTHKNVLGQTLVFAFILLLLGWRFRAVPKPVALGGMALAAGLAVPAGSATALLLLALLLAVQLLPAILSLPPRRRAAALLLLVGAGSFALLGGVLLLEPLVAVLGRDLTFTGRTDLWAYVVSMIGHRPLLGYGYAVFFDLASVARYVEDALRWKVPNAHNGFLEVALGLGLPGALAVTLLLLGGLRRAVAELAAADSDPKRHAASFGLLYLTVYLIRNVVESDVLGQSQLSWVLAVVAVLVAAPRAAAGREAGVRCVPGIP
jgi:exopolysaccharide production protein ExoQ